MAEIRTNQRTIVDRLGWLLAFTVNLGVLFGVHHLWVALCCAPLVAWLGWMAIR